IVVVRPEVGEEAAQRRVQLGGRVHAAAGRQEEVVAVGVALHAARPARRPVAEAQPAAALRQELPARVGDERLGVGLALGRRRDQELARGRADRRQAGRRREEREREQESPAGQVGYCRRVQESDASLRSTATTLSETATSDTVAPGKMVAKLRCSVLPTAVASGQPDSVARLVTVSPPPREMSFARASRLVWMNAFALREPPPVSVQFEVPDEMPNVWVPNRPFVVAARIWIAPGFASNAIDPRPQPAIPYGSARAAVAPAASAVIT